MQRKATKNTRGPNADEKRFQGWLKENACVWCGSEGPSIVDHCRGATFKHNKVLIGHWFCLPQCVTCDTQKTIHGKRLGNESKEWGLLTSEYLCAINDFDVISVDVYNAIMDWGR
jgi:hypothetical protein